MITRRALIGGIGLAVAAPAVVRASSLMRISPLEPTAYYKIGRDWSIYAWSEPGKIATPLRIYPVLLSGKAYQGSIICRNGKWTDDRGRRAEVDLDSFVDRWVNESPWPEYSGRLIQPMAVDTP